MKHIRTTSACILACTWALLSGCSPASEESVKAVPALEQIKSVIHDFGVANEFQYANERTYSADMAKLKSAARVYSGDTAKTEADDPEWPHADSVELRVGYAGSDGWTVVATHKRLGPPVGCAYAYGSGPPVRTPTGTLFEGGWPPPCDLGIGS